MHATMETLITELFFHLLAIYDYAYWPDIIYIIWWLKGCIGQLYPFQPQGTI